MKSLEKNKGTIIALILFALVMVFYQVFFKAEEAVVDQGASAAAVGNDIIALGRSLDDVTLDLTLFNSPLYRALVDFSPNLVPQPVGRSHPFDPVGK